MDKNFVQDRLGKTVAATRFKAECLRIIEEMSRDREPVTVTRHGRPVARLVPFPADETASIVGALKGSVLRFEEPFAPATGPEDWNAVR
jgi:prevent-host-death family protein